MRYAALCCYYGTFPNYFDLWLESANKNSMIDFYIITDELTLNTYKEKIRVYKNVKIINLTFEELKQRIQNLFNFKIKLDKPYKLCDYRLAFGLVFENELRNYDYFGWYDIDTILGDFSGLFKNKTIETYDVIGNVGHFTLLKNNERMKMLFYDSERKRNSATYYKKVFKTNASCFFDEVYGLRMLCNDLNVLDIRNQIADIKYSFFNFYCNLLPDSFILKKQKDGKLFIISRKEIIEVLYAHLQKRELLVDKNIGDEYYVIPNSFTNKLEEITYNAIRYKQLEYKMERVFIRAKIVNIISNLFKK